MTRATPVTRGLRRVTTAGVIVAVLLVGCDDAGSEAPSMPGGSVTDPSPGGPPPSGVSVSDPSPGGTPTPDPPEEGPAANPREDAPTEPVGPSGDGPTHGPAGSEAGTPPEAGLTGDQGEVG